MRILLDEMLPISLRELLPNHEVVSAGYAGYAGLPNGQLLRRAAADAFDVLITLDLGIPDQQNVARRDIRVVLIPDNDVDLIQPYADDLREAIEQAAPGTVIRVHQ